MSNSLLNKYGNNFQRELRIWQEISKSMQINKTLVKWFNIEMSIHISMTGENLRYLMKIIILKLTNLLKFLNSVKTIIHLRTQQNSKQLQVLIREIKLEIICVRIYMMFLKTFKNSSNCLRSVTYMIWNLNFWKSFLKITVTKLISQMTMQFTIIWFLSYLLMELKNQIIP
jgi:hypothetical protein